MNGCVLGHTAQAMECPGCAEANGSDTSVEWWRWYRSRTSSKAIKTAITNHLASLSDPDLSRGTHADTSRPLVPEAS